MKKLNDANMGIFVLLSVCLSCFHATMTTTTYQRTMQHLNIEGNRMNVKATNPKVS